MIPLTKALERIKCPTDLINFIINLFKNRKLQVITAYGLSKGFYAGDGIDQGETISPLIWRIFYDPLLTRIKDIPEVGYRLITQWPSSEGTDINKTQHELKTSVVAYADDTAWIASNKKEMETIIGISNSFFKLNNIRINGDKSELLVWNAPKDVIKSIKMGTNNDLVVAKKPSQESKYLGVYIKSQAGSSHIVKRVKNEIKSMVNLLKYKKITESQVVYVNNVVLMARLEYWLKCTFLTQNQCRTLHNCMILLLKQKMRITKSANNNIFTHQGLVGMTSLLQHLRTAQYADFIVRINSQEWDGISTRIILRNAQLRAGLAGCILTIEPSKLLQVNIPNNFNFNILKDIKDQLFNFDAINVDDWHLDILDTTILDFLLQPNYNHNNTRLDHDLSERK
ncbi:unnamed protein product [Rhizophagus irregularis]|uniref:Reverse transcriptase domain-containing protein n=3 Tax=Rhizophagus irregularis TaxID=588596 RepID=A0A915ZP68_9GLOM|nr:unnamed protein product [Rhizophagus irregularis]